ncbi:MAG TPA: succinyldiaminopimelate transaminase [Gammaproteobacteria bacterium]|nr:succinyldiaminopimelate transaminase [Gammaproteobacteria bacterium]
MTNPKLELLQSYPFEKLRAALASSDYQGDLAHIALSIGEPKHPPPQFVIDALCDGNATAQHLATYPATRGSDGLRHAVSDWLRNRFGVTASAEQHILPVNGTREALFAFAQAVLSGRPQSLVGMPNPFYQIYEGAALLAGAQPYYMANTAHSDYAADYDAVSDETWDAMELLYICSPGNPTGHLISDVQMQRLIERAHRHDFIIAADECYSEIYFSEQNRPSSLLAASEAMGNKEFARCVVFHSLSKRSNLPGLRSGFVAGDAGIIEKFLLYRTYHGCAMGTHQQYASTLAWQDEAHVRENRALYQEKFQAVTDVLQAHYDLQQPDGGFYHWLPTPTNDLSFCQSLYAQQHITVMPGSFLGRDQAMLGNPGANHVRVAWVAPMAACVDAAHRLAEFADRVGNDS